MVVPPKDASVAHQIFWQIGLEPEGTWPAVVAQLLSVSNAVQVQWMRVEASFGLQLAVVVELAQRELKVTFQVGGYLDLYVDSLVDLVSGKLKVHCLFLLLKMRRIFCFEEFLPSDDGSGAVVSAVFVFPGLSVDVVVTANSTQAFVLAMLNLK